MNLNGFGAKYLSGLELNCVKKRGTFSYYFLLVRGRVTGPGDWREQFYPPAGAMAEQVGWLMMALTSIN